MDVDAVASKVLQSVGGAQNVVSSTLCMTRLRLALVDPDKVDQTALSDVPGVLGIAKRGHSGIEVVFGPNVVHSVYDAVSQLCGTNGGVDTEDAPANQEHRLKVSVIRGSHGEEDVGTLVSSTLDADDEDDAHDEVDFLASLLADVEEEEDEGEPTGRPALLVVNGPNINMLGIREPDLYGSESFDTLLELCHTTAHEAGFARCTCFQSNHEGDIVDTIQDAYGVFDGIVINPAAYTHTSVALLDALRAVSIPTIEVHISRVDMREDFRQVSYLRSACLETIAGEGIQGYAHAIRSLADHLGDAREGGSPLTPHPHTGRG